MALIDKLTEIGNAIRKKNGTTDPIPLVDMPQAILDITSGSEGEVSDWYDFTITVTSEATNGEQLLDVFSPYLTELQGGKDVAFITLLNANVAANAVGTATQCSVTRMMEQGVLVGKMTRYRSYNNIVFNVVDMTNGYSISPFAGAVYYVKVVRVIA